MKLLSLYQAARHGHRHGSSHEPWKRGKRKGRKHDRHGGYGRPPAPSALRRRFGRDPYGHARPRGLKGVVIDAIVRKLLKHR